MPSKNIRDFKHFLRIEKENESKSILILGEVIDIVDDLDSLYRDCLELGAIDKKELKIPAFLYFNVHREFYLAMSNFLRLNASKSFCSLRAAIDSAFTAYYLLKKPGRIDIYLSTINRENEKEWNRIFRNIKETMRKKIADFPAAERLLRIHEFCSTFSHSDAVSIMHRYQEDKTRLMLEAKYFDYEDSEEDYKKWLAPLLSGFFKIFLIFWKELFKKRAGDKLSEMETKIQKYSAKVKSFRLKYPIQTGT